MTASHNPIGDNGVKMVDPDGGMLDMKWEKVRPFAYLTLLCGLIVHDFLDAPQYACEIANCTVDSLQSVIESIISSESIEMANRENAVVHLGRDTRPSSAHLSDLVARGVRAFGCTVTDHGLVTTPQLHHVVRFSNLPNANPRYKGVEGYYTIHATSFLDLISSVPSDVTSSRGPLFVDCAHGIGAQAVSELGKRISSRLDIRAVNIGSTEEEQQRLNDGCGAEYVQKGRKKPSGMTSEEFDHTRNCSLDGDADRVVFHYVDSNKQWQLLDGDKIATLLAIFVSELCKQSKLQLTKASNEQANSSFTPKNGKEALEYLRCNPLSLGLVQTAYANGASTRYLRSLGLPVLTAKTGVKYVHAKAEEFDVGVYFEANGHGTVLFSPFIANLLEKAGGLSDTEMQELFDGDSAAALAFRRLTMLPRLVNQAVGDAISDLLLVEAVLILKGWTLDQWNAIYADSPTAQGKLCVHDKTVFQTTEDETRLVKPESVQAELDALMSKYPNSRTFVRPSGTEDIVRLYCEASTEQDAQSMLHDVQNVLASGGYVRS